MSNTNVRFKLAPPWVIFVNEIKALFERDPEIGITYDNDECTVKLHVENHEKAEAIAWMLPVEKEFGNVTLKINVIPANANLSTERTDYTKMSCGEIFDIMFKGNPAYKYSRTIDGILSNRLTYVVMERRVVSYFSDNLNDLFGNITTLYQEIAHDVFNGDNLRGVFFCTEPSGELVETGLHWP